MPRNITVTLADGTRHVYANAPDTITPDQVSARALRDFGKPVKSLDGGRAAVPVQTKRQAVQDTARAAIQAGQGAAAGDAGPGFFTALGAGVRRSMFGIPERLAAAGERFLPSAITGNTTNASYDDILKAVRARTDAEMNRSTTGNVLGQIVGSVAAGGGAGKLATRGIARLAGSAAPAAARVGNVLQGLTAFKKGQTVANVGRSAVVGASQGAAQAVGEGGDPITGAAAGAVGGAGLHAVGHLAKVAARPIGDVLRLTTAPQILSRFTSMSPEAMRSAADRYRASTGAEPTLFELLPLADRNKILKNVVAGKDPIVEQTTDAIRARAANLGPEMSARAEAILTPQRAQIRDQMMQDMATARGGENHPDDGGLVDRAMQSPTDMHALRSTEAGAIMAPHENTPVVDNLHELFPSMEANTAEGGTAAIETDPEVSAMIRSAAGSLRRRAPDQPLTAGEVTSMISNLGDIRHNGSAIESNAADRAINHLHDMLETNAPEAGDAARQMRDAFASRSRMMEGMDEGMQTRLRDNIRLSGGGTSGQTANRVRNAYDSPEGETGRLLGQSNQVLNSLEGSPQDALRSTIGISRNDTGRELAQNLTPQSAAPIVDAAQAQDASAQALAAAGQKAQAGDPDSRFSLVQTIAALHPGSFMTTKAHAVQRLITTMGIPLNRARTMVDMVFSQDPTITNRAIDAIGQVKGGGQFLSDLSSTVGQLAGGNVGAAPNSGGPVQDATDELPSTLATPADTLGDAPLPDTLDGMAGPDFPADAPPAAPADGMPAGEPVDPASSPYAEHLQQLQENENPDLLALADRVQNQESGGRQHDGNGRPLRSSKGAVGLMQIMPGTAPNAAKLAGLPYDDTAYHHDPVYNKLLGVGYLSQMLRRYGGDPAKATAAYNAGPGKVDAALRKSPDKWLTLLPAETQDYVQKVS